MKKNLILSEASVLDTLQAFAELGLVRRVSLPSPIAGVTSRHLVGRKLRTLRRPRRRRSDAIGGDKQSSVSIRLAGRECIHLPQSNDNLLLKAVLEEFCPRFVPGGVVVYIGVSETRFSHFDAAYLRNLGVAVEEHGKMPDVVVHFTKENWLVLIEAVTSHGPVNPKRLTELKALFAGSKAGLVFVTAFLDRRGLLKYLAEIAWETEVWVAAAPDHMIHFNGERFLGPY